MSILSLMYNIKAFVISIILRRRKDFVNYARKLIEGSMEADGETEVCSVWQNSRL